MVHLPVFWAKKFKKFWKSLMMLTARTVLDNQGEIGVPSKRALPKALPYGLGKRSLEWQCFMSPITFPKKNAHVSLYKHLGSGLRLIRVNDFLGCLAF